MTKNNSNFDVSKVNDLLNGNSELIIVKGQLQSPEKKAKNGTGELYYCFTLKSSKQYADDEYGQGFNTRYCVIGPELSKSYNDDLIKSYKGNEVIVFLDVRARVVNVKGDNGKANIYNRVQYFVADIFLVRELDRKITSSVANTIKL